MPETIVPIAKALPALKKQYQLGKDMEKDHEYAFWVNTTNDLLKAIYVNLVCESHMTGEK
jgi:hypothetical protein